MNIYDGSNTPQNSEPPTTYLTCLDQMVDAFFRIQPGSENLPYKPRVPAEDVRASSAIF